MVLNACIEPSIKIGIHMFKFGISHWLLLLLTVLFFSRVRLMVIGFIGFVINILGFLDGPLPFIDIFTMFLQSIVWMFIILNSPINLGLRIILIPSFMLTGFLWDAIGGLPHLGFLNFVPLTPLVTYLMYVKNFNYIVIALPAVLTVWLLLGISTPLCTSVNEVLILLATPCKSLLSNVPVLGWILRLIMGC